MDERQDVENRQEEIPAGNTHGLRLISTTFSRFCHKHSFKPLRLLIAIGLIVFILIISGILGIRSLSISSRTVKFGLKNIGELATQVAYYTNVQTISDSRQVLGVTVPFTQSNYIYSYDGAIKVGFNFEDIDVNVDDLLRSITIKIPDPIVISNEVDEGSLQVYNESINIFTPLALDTVNTSQKVMKEKALENAVNNGVFEMARSNVEMILTGFIAGSYNLQDYSIRFE